MSAKNSSYSTEPIKNPPSSGEIFQRFSSAIHSTGFDFNMDLLKYEKTA